MVRQDLLDWVQLAEGKGYTRDQLHMYLVGKGFLPADVDAALDAVQEKNLHQVAQPVEEKKKPLLPWHLSFSILTKQHLIFAGAALGLIVFFIILFAGGNDSSVIDRVQRSPTNLQTIVTPCTDFPQALVACEELTCQFAHPVTGDILTREVLGSGRTGCVYREGTPSGGAIRCQMTEELAEQYVDFYEATNDGRRRSTKTYRVNGKDVANPLQEAINSGICTVS